MNKAELLAYIATLVAQLTELNIEFTPAQTTGTNAELEQEIERLESLLPDEDEPAPTENGTDAKAAHDDSLTATANEDKTLKADADEQEKTTRLVLIKKGVNIETIKNGKKVVLIGDTKHTLDAAFAKSIVAENHGSYTTADEQDDEV